MANGDADDDEAPPAVRQWEPSDLAKRIASGHAGSVHFAHVSQPELAAMIQLVIDTGRAKRHRDRSLYWHPDSGLAVLLNPRDPDGGTAFPSDAEYFGRWSYAEEDDLR